MRAALVSFGTDFILLTVVARVVGMSQAGTSSSWDDVSSTTKMYVEADVYEPVRLVGRKGFEPSTFRLSVERSTKLSYRPTKIIFIVVIYSCGYFE